MGKKPQYRLLRRTMHTVRRRLVELEKVTDDMAVLHVDELSDLYEIVDRYEKLYAKIRPRWRNV